MAMGEATANGPKHRAPEASDTPVLIYVPGLGPGPDNTADMVAESLRDSLDNQRPGIYEARDGVGISAPTGLKVSKTLVDGDGTPVLQVFEFDYASTLSPAASSAAPAVVPGAVRAVGSLARAIAMMVPAWGRSAKSFKSKAQLSLGLAACALLAVFAAVAVVALLTAMGLNLPSKVDGLLGEDPADWKLGIPALGLVVGWPVLRKSLLALAAVVQDCIRFVENDDVVADTISENLNEALDRLPSSGWNGPVHLLGYSFGSLVLFETLFPRATAMRGYAPPARIGSLVTIGCPLDIVRLFRPSYLSGREARVQVAWTNVFNQADLFASNLKNENDTEPGRGVLSVDNDVLASATSKRYTNEKLHFGRLLTTFRSHSGYWGTNRASCFNEIAGALVPEADPEPAPVPVA